MNKNWTTYDWEYVIPTRYFENEGEVSMEELYQIFKERLYREWQEEMMKDDPP